MKSPSYRCAFERDDNGTFLVSCAALPELVTYGDTPADAAVHALGAIEEAIAARIHDGRTVPSAQQGGRARAGEFVVKLPQLTAQKVLLYNLLSELGMSRADLARRLGWHREQVDRLFRLDHASKAAQLDSAFRALGHEVEIIVRKDDSGREAA